MKSRLIDSAIATILVFVSMSLFPVILSHSFFEPFFRTFADLSITDYEYAEMREDEPVEENIIIINTSHISNAFKAMILEYISNYNPSVVAIESISLSGIEPDDSMLVAAVKNSGKVVLGTELEGFNPNDESYDIQQNELMKFDGLPVGFTNLFLGDKKEKEHVTIRRFFKTAFCRAKKYNSFAIETAIRFKPEISSILNSRNNKFETINYRGDFKKFIFVNASDVIEMDSSVFEGKIVLLGDADVFSERHNLRDKYFTPMNPFGSGRSFPDMYGIEIQANIVSMLIAGNFNSALPTWLSLVIAATLCFLNMYLLFIISDRFKIWYEIISLVLFVGESLVILVLTVILYHENYFELNLNIAIFAIALSIPISEGYYDSLKPLSIQFFNKLFRRKK